MQQAGWMPIRILFTLLLLPMTTACQAESAVQPAAWTKNLSIYQVNTRQFSKSGTFAEVEKQLPRLKELGAGIVWLMPIHPIGNVERKGTLGSPYSVLDYRDVNPEFGTREDLRSLVARAHELGLYVILDWVANHTAHDHPWAVKHPAYYHKNKDGSFINPGGWIDVIHLNYASDELRREMLSAMRYWVEEFDIDGFRADVAGMVPMDFWAIARTELNRIRPIFMLAEDQGPEFHRDAFDMTYSFAGLRLLHQVASGKRGVGALHHHLAAERKQGYPDSAYRMLYTTNHDLNSWNGTVFERFGDAAEAAMVFCCVHRGMPLIYNGQEAGLDHRLAFFEKDEIKWKEHRFRDIITRLLHLKQRNQALWNGSDGGDVRQLKLTTPAGARVYAFIREKNGHRVLAAFNFDGTSADASLRKPPPGTWVNVLTDDEQEAPSLQLAPFGYVVLEGKKTEIGK